MQDIENIKCPKCNTIVIKGTKKCPKCHTNLDTNQKSCPKCAKRNDIKSPKCIRCGYNFNHKPRSLIYNIIFSILVVIILFILVGLEYTGLVTKVNILIKILAIIFLLFVIYKNINYGTKDIIKYHEDASNNQPEIKKKARRMKRFSSCIIILAGLAILIFLITYYLKNR